MCESLTTPTSKEQEKKDCESERKKSSLVFFLTVSSFLFFSFSLSVLLSFTNGSQGRPGPGRARCRGSKRRRRRRRHRGRRGGKREFFFLLSPLAFFFDRRRCRRRQLFTPLRRLLTYLVSKILQLLSPTGARGDEGQAGGDGGRRGQAEGRGGEHGFFDLLFQSSSSVDVDLRLSAVFLLSFAPHPLSPSPSLPSLSN